MTTYGSTPGVKISTQSGTVGGVEIGREQYCILVGAGNNSAGSAATNEPVAIESRSDADDKFGADSDLAEAYRDAIANGANPDFMVGVMAKTTEANESVTATGSGSLTNAPLLAQADRITVDDTGNSVTDLTVRFQYGGAPNAPSSSDVVHINPISGEWAAASSSDYDFTYDYADWQTAIEAVPNVMVEREFGILHVLTNAGDVVSTIQSVVSQMRDNLKLVLPVINAEPNNSVDFRPAFDESTFTNPYDDDTLFSVAPTALAGASNDEALYGFGASPAVAGLFAGTATTEPIYDKTLDGLGDGLAEQLSRSDVQSLSDQYVIPVRDIGTPRLERNHSTYDQSANGGWERDFYTRRIVDLTVATVHGIAQQAIGGVLDDDTPADVESLVRNELEELVADGLLEDGGQSVNVYEDSRDTLGIDLGITPNGVLKQVNSTLTVQV